MLPPASKERLAEEDPGTIETLLESLQFEGRSHGVQ